MELLEKTLLQSFKDQFPEESVGKYKSLVRVRIYLDFCFFGTTVWKPVTTLASQKFIPRASA